MDLHKKFESSPSVDFSILSKNGNLRFLLDELIRNLDEELLKGTISINNLKTYHMLLCNEYQKRSEKSFKDNLSILNLFPQLKNFSQEQLLIICDIFILRLFFHPEHIFPEFEIFRKITDSLEEKETKLFIKITECFLDTLRLLKFSQYRENSTLQRNQIENFRFLYEKNEEPDWKSLVSLLPKLIEISDFESLKPLWRSLLKKHDLTGFCIFVNSCLETKITEISQFFQEATFWEILLIGLKSRLESERKQALYLFKIVTELPGLKIPFTCAKNPDSMKIVRNNFILILEALEEKRQHLVLPSFSILKNLVSANHEHQNCPNCFDFSWLSCIFEKILRHENNTVVKFGLNCILDLEPQLFENDFLKSVTEALNNRFLYESEEELRIFDDKNKEEPKNKEELFQNEDLKSLPKIVPQLEQFLLKNLQKLNLISKFLAAIAEISWDPISIFYVIFALSCATKKINSREIVGFFWGEEQLLCLKKLIEKNLTLYSPILRQESQKNVLIVMTRLTGKINLKIFGNFLASFPKKDEILSRNSQIIKKFLTRIQVERNEVEDFLRDFCENIQDGRQIESFTRIFVILDDSILEKENREKYLLQLFCNIQSINSRPYMNFELADQVLEVIHQLLDFSESSEIILPFLEDATDFLLLAAKRPNLNYDNVKKYSVILGLILKKNSNIANFLEKLDQEGIYCLENANIVSGLRRLYGINVLLICQKWRNGFLSKDTFSLILTNHTIPLIFEEEESLSGIKGRATTDYYSIIAEIIDRFLETGAEIPENCFFTASSLFDKGGLTGVPFVIGILSKILTKKSLMENNLDEMKILIKTCWKSIFAEKKSRIFWKSFDKILRFILNPEGFGFEDNFVQELVNEILEEGESAPNLKLEFLKQLKNLETKELSFFKKAIFNCLLHGQVPRKDEKIELQTHEFLSRKNCELKNHNVDMEIRVRAIILFHKIISWDEKSSSEFLNLAINCLHKFKGKRYFGGSNSHRIQQRIFQVLIILEPILNKNCRDKLEAEIVSIVLSNFADQPSTQIMMSWILSRLYCWPDNDSFLHFFREIKEKRPGNMRFLAGVILQIANFLSMEEEDEDFKRFCKTSISHFAPECLGPNFNTRLSCQIVLAKLYEKLKEKDALQKAVIKTLNLRNAQLLNEFYYENFHLFHNYSLQVST